jgi:cellulose synthase/poly-beta-1,6-N-acetylglucosamine synthase-like glycosyltransferase
VPYFDDGKISYVQAPQDHRDWKGDRFKEMLNWEYAGFFDIGMCLRNEYDAIIQHGTMTLVRRDLMEELGGWATWCITEDTELGLRLMEKGYGAMYSRERFGHGLTPDHFAGYKKQRFRWAYGAMQIMKAHAGKMLSNSTKLTFAQKYHFIAGWMPWFADALNLIFTWAGLAWLLAVVLPPLFGIKPVGLPPAEFILPTIGIFVFKLLYSFGLYFDRVRCTFRQSIGASLAGLALTYTVGRAVIYGLMTSRLPFMRTPKMDERATLGMALGMARGEAVLTILLWLGAIVLWMGAGAVNIEARLWAVFMVVQSLPYAAAVYVSVVNALEQMRHARAVFEAAPPASHVAGPAMQPAQ